MAHLLNFGHVYVAPKSTLPWHLLLGGLVAVFYTFAGAKRRSSFRFLAGKSQCSPRGRQCRIGATGRAGLHGDRQAPLQSGVALRCRLDALVFPQGVELPSRLGSDGAQHSGPKWPRSPREGRDAVAVSRRGRLFHRHRRLAQEPRLRRQRDPATQVRIDQSRTGDLPLQEGPGLGLLVDHGASHRSPTPQHLSFWDPEVVAAMEPKAVAHRHQVVAGAGNLGLWPVHLPPAQAPDQAHRVDLAVFSGTQDQKWTYARDFHEGCPATEPSHPVLYAECLFSRLAIPAIGQSMGRHRFAGHDPDLCDAARDAAHQPAHGLF